MTRLPLSRRRIMVTRARLQASSLSQKLTELGATVIEEPLLELKMPGDWADVDQAIDRIEQYHYIVFASANAVRFFCDRWNEKRPTVHQPTETKIAAIGPATASELEQFNLHADYQPSEFVADAFVREFTQNANITGKRILWPKTNIGRTIIKDALTAAGANVDAIVCYVTDAPDELADTGKRIVALVEQGKIDAITLASAQTVRNLKKAVDLVSKNAETLFKPICLAAIGPETAKAARELFPTSHVISASEYTADGIARALTKDFGDRPND